MWEFNPIVLLSDWKVEMHFFLFSSVGFYKALIWKGMDWHKYKSVLRNWPLIFSCLILRSWCTSTSFLRSVHRCCHWLLFSLMSNAISPKNKFLFDLKLTYFDGIVWCDNALEVCKPSFICRQQEQEQKLKVNWSKAPAVCGGDCGHCICSSLGDCSIFLADLSAIQSSPFGLTLWRRQNVVQEHICRLTLWLAWSQTPAASSCALFLLLVLMRHIHCKNFFSWFVITTFFLLSNQHTSFM